jgi:DNA-binding CsgD family transcriptional regulator
LTNAGVLNEYFSTKGAWQTAAVLCLPLLPHINHQTMADPAANKKEFFQVETDLDTIMEYTRMLEQFYPDKVVQICRQHHEAAFYVSENCKDFWGIPARKMKFLTMKEYLAIIHPDDMAVMGNVQKVIDSYVQHEEDPTSTRYTLIYRMKGADGLYHTVEDEKVVLKTKTGLYAHFCTYTKTTDKVTVALEIYKVINNKKTKVKSHLFAAAAGTLSPRELEIIKLIDKGYNNAELSEYLSLSIYTVKNHKQRLFRKMNVKNTIELLRSSRDQNLI